jgi:hypothetical protein
MTELLANYKLLITPQDFELFNSHSNLIASGIVLFLGFWIVEWTIYGIVTLVSSHEDLKSHKNRHKITRNMSEALTMAVISYLGFETFFAMDGFAPFVKGIGVAKLFAYSGSAQRLALFQTVYEVKNFINSYVGNDGMLFLVHHVFACALSFFALHPFLHYYSSFFLGMCEISTVVLCLFLNFDAKSGVPALAKVYPTIELLLGVIFAILFIIIRIIAWFYFTYHFWFDMLELIQTGQVHDWLSVGSYIVGNVGLTSLQVYWLKDILVQGTQKLLLSDSDKLNNQLGPDYVEEPADSTSTATPTKKNNTNTKKTK